MPTSLCLRIALLVALVLAPVGVAAGGDGSDDRALRRELAARGVDPAEVVFPHEIDERMASWVESAVSARLSKDERVQALLAQLLTGRELELKYFDDYTGTAVEVFESGEANCLAFTHLFVGLGRHLDLPVYYLKVDDLQGFERQGDLVVVSGHITAGYGPKNRPQILEFAIFPNDEYQQIRPLSDISALALFYSNRGAELLLGSDVPRALEWLQMAVRIDPQLPEAWLNLGVAFRRDGRVQSAEQAYRRALAIDPENVSAYQNLSALLLKVVGREEEGRQLLELTDVKANRNPFNFLVLGDLSLAQGRLGDAERYYRRALKLAPDEAEAMAAMGLWAVADGRRRAARKWLRKARKRDAEDARVLQLAQELFVEGTEQ